jgi:hypothetical protein
MRKISTHLLIFLFLLFGATTLFAQNYVEIPLENGQQFNTKAIIDADSSNPVDGYLLERGGYYWFDGAVRHDYPLALIGKDEPADQPPPVLLVKTDSQGEAPSQIIESYGDLHLENLYIGGVDDLGNRRNFVNILGEDIRLVVTNCYFTLGNDWQGFFYINNRDLTFIFENNVCFNFQREDGFDWTRITFGRNTDPLDTLIFRHNTFWGVAGELYGMKGEPDYTLIEHNTFVAEGQLATTMEIFPNAIFRNNLYHNVHIHGDAIGNARGFNRSRNENQVDLPLSNFMIDTLGTGWPQETLDSVLAVAGVPYQTINIHHNNFFLHPDIVSYLEAQEDTIVMVPPMAPQRTLDMAANDAEFPGIDYDLATNTQLDPGFTNDPSSITDMIAWVSFQMYNDEENPPANFLWAADGEWTEAEDVFVFNWPIESMVDFTYSNGALVSSDGYHMGDLYHWYPDEYAQWLLTDVKEVETDYIPNEFALEQNYPNPFNPTTNILFSIPQSGLVTLKVYNVLGQEIANLVNQELKAGVHKVDFDASNLTSGVYFYTMESGDFVQTQKMLLLK